MREQQSESLSYGSEELACKDLQQAQLHLPGHGWSLNQSVEVAVAGKTGHSLQLFQSD